MAETIVGRMSGWSLVPARPRKITAGELHARLAAQGFETHLRSVERDLHKIGGKFGLVCDEAKPAGWSWAVRDTQLTFPPMNTETALTYELLSRYLAPMLPRRMSNLLEPEFARARRVLDDLREAPIGRWAKRIAVLPYGQQLLPPEVATDVSEVVYDALLHERRFEADYRAAGAGRIWRRMFNPLGLVYREGVLYLVATVANYADPRHYALQRMSKAQALDEAAATPEGFDFERYVREEKSFDYPLGPDIKLELIVDADLAPYLAESRLSADQVLTPIRGRDEYRLVARVADTDKLLWWLRSRGPGVEVVRPAALRRRMREGAKVLARMYG